MIALSDGVMAMAWFTLFFKGLSTGLWPFYMMYLILCCGRIYYYILFSHEDNQFTRKNNYYSQISSSATFVFIYFIQLITMLIKNKSFPFGFFLWIIFSAINFFYPILIARQHYMNYDIDLMKSKIVIDTGDILTQDLKAAENPYLEHLQYNPSADMSYNNLSSHQVTTSSYNGDETMKSTSMSKYLNSDDYGENSRSSVKVRVMHDADNSTF